MNVAAYATRRSRGAAGRRDALGGRHGVVLAAGAGVAAGLGVFAGLGVLAGLGVFAGLGVVVGSGVSWARRSRCGRRRGSPAAPCPRGRRGGSAAAGPGPGSGRWSAASACRSRRPPSRTPGCVAHREAVLCRRRAGRGCGRRCRRRPGRSEPSRSAASSVTGSSVEPTLEHHRGERARRRRPAARGRRLGRVGAELREQAALAVHEEPARRPPARPAAPRAR